MSGRPQLNFYDWRSKIWDLLDKFSVEDLAEKIGIHERTLYRWLTTDRTVRGGYLPHRNPNTLHIRQIKRLWYYHIRGY